MSQYQMQNATGQSIIYGFDPVSGYFIHMQERDGVAIAQRSSAADGLTGSELVDAAEEHGLTLPEAHQLCAMLDLPLDLWNPLLVGQ